MTADEEYMEKALLLAQKAAKAGEVPVGAIIVDKNGEVVGEGYNRREELCSPTAHAEMLAIEQAAQKLRSRRLSDCTLYVTLEPCPMCAGACINAGLRRVVYGAFDEKNGACASVVTLFAERFTHKPLVRSRVLEKRCGEVLTEFFSSIRGKS